MFLIRIEFFYGLISKEILVVTLPSKISPSESDACRDIHCDFDATCELGPDNFPRCTCKFDCNNTISNSKPVCASDLRMYPSMCVMKLESCQRQEELRLRPLDLCQGKKFFGLVLSKLRKYIKKFL